MECCRFPLWFVMKFLYVPSRWDVIDVIAEKGRLSGCRLYEHMAHLGHCATREKALLNTEIYKGQVLSHTYTAACLALCPQNALQNLIVCPMYKY